MSGVNISTHPEAGHAYNLEVGGSLSVPSGSIVCVFVFEFVFVLVFTFLFVFVLVNVFAIAAIGTCQILIGGLCLPKGYPPTHHTSFVDIFLPNKMAFLHKMRFSTK